MRAVVKRQLEKRSLPLVLAHGGGAAHGRENSIEAIRESLRFDPDIIELDVRKSFDGVLYCHHGSIPVGVSAAQFYHLLTFFEIQTLVGHRNTLKEALTEIPSTSIVHLDLKDRRISAEDLKPLVMGRQNVWLGVWTLRHLRSLRKDLGDEFVFVLLRPLMFLKRNLTQLCSLADSVFLYPWQWNKKNAKELAKAGIFCSTVQGLYFRPHDKRMFIVEKKHAGIVRSYDDLRNNHRVKEAKKH